jgi:predicted AAA+ superfamily ATPase
MYPMAFFEFINAGNYGSLSQAIQNANCKNPFSGPVHNTSVELLRKFLIIGGMPE